MAKIDKKPGIPKRLTDTMVGKFIGINTFVIFKNKLKQYNTINAKQILFTTKNIFFFILSPLNHMKFIIIYEIFFRSASALSKVIESK